MDVFPALLEEIGQALGVVAGHVVEHRGLGESELLGDEIGHHRSLERVQEGSAEDPGSVQGGVGIGGPGANHGRFVVIRHATRRHCLLGGLRPDDDQHLVLGDQLRVDGRCRFPLGLVVLDDQLNLVLLAPYLKTTGGVDVLEPHLGRKLGAFTHLGDVAGDRGVDADLDGFGCGGRHHTGRKQSQPQQHQYQSNSNLFHGEHPPPMGLSTCKY